MRQFFLSTVESAHMKDELHLTYFILTVVQQKFAFLTIWKLSNKHFQPCDPRFTS